MLWLFLGAIVAVAMYTWQQRRGLYRAHSQMPCDLPSYPILGHAHLFRGTNEVMTDPESVEVVTKACLEKDNTTMKYIRLVLGNGIAFGPVKIWRPRRKIMAPTFKTKNLQQFVKIFDKQSRIMVDRLRERVGQGDFSFWNYITTTTFDSVCESALGVVLNSQKHSGHPFIHAFGEMTKIIAHRILSPWLYWDWVFKLTPLYGEFIKYRQLTFDFFDQIIQDKRNDLASKRNNNDVSEDKLTNFLEMLIMFSGADKGHSDLELREEVMSIVMAGTDTSAVAVAFTVVLLSRYPDVQDKVYQELRSVFGDSDRAVAWEDLPRLQYLEAIVKETLRLYPPVPVLVREVEDIVQLPSGIKLVPGMAIILEISGIHRNTKFWGEDVEQFRPERFLEPLRHPAQFIPFSYSVRNCLGINYAMMSAKINLANLLRHYRVLPPADLSPAEFTKPLRVEFDIMMKHVDNYEVRLEHREKI